jgi:pre-mRNA-splicing helicase BRR2
LSEVVEGTVADLEESRCISVVDENELSGLNLGMIAAYYYIRYTTIEVFASSLTAKTKLKGLIEILSAASEFEDLPIRHNEEKTLKKLATHLPQNLESPKYTEAQTKANIMFQTHFSRTTLGVDLKADQNAVLAESLRLLQACVDVISSNGWLKPALAAMELSQMICQGQWDKDSVLLQLPHFNKEICARCEAAEEEVEGIFDIMGLEDDTREKLLQLPPAKMAGVAGFCNQYPNIDVNFEVSDPDNVQAGKQVTVVVQLERDADEDDEDMGVPQEAIANSPRYPKTKTEGWWLVVGDTKTNSLLSIKRIAVKKKAQTKLQFTAPSETGDCTYSLFFMCDCYLGCDQEYEIDLNVKEGVESSEEEDSDDDEE